jgi:hypothetical protein
MIITSHMQNIIQIYPCLLSHGSVYYLMAMFSIPWLCLLYHDSVYYLMALFIIPASKLVIFQPKTKISPKTLAANITM